jgi:methylase of polypeptide subunit release factors
MTPQDDALLALLERLRAQGYAFVAPTPASHARVLKRLDMQEARDLRGVFGWSLPFAAETLDPDLLDLMRRAGAVAPSDAGLKSRFRVASLGGRLFLHSAYPTESEDAVFLGPDSYRFDSLIRCELDGAEPPTGAVLDIGAGAGVGALAAADRLPGRRLIMTDINPEALRLARINAAFAGVPAEAVEADGLDGVEGPIAVALANPPYIADDAGRDYRDGGGMFGGSLSVAMAQAAGRRLVPGGRLILYTGAAIVGGRDPLRGALRRVLAAEGCSLTYRELDPDVFGEELDRPAYGDVERIAVVAATAVKEG